jgi:hypothetical protein
LFLSVAGSQPNFLRPVVAFGDHPLLERGMEVYVFRALAFCKGDGDGVGRLVGLIS